MSDCPVCYEQLTEQNQVVLCANEHKICRECLQGMIRSNRSPKCPMDRGDIIWANVPEDLRPVRRDDRVRERRGGPVDIPALQQQRQTAEHRRAEALILQAELREQQAEIARQLANVNELVANMGEVIRVRNDQIRIAEAHEQLDIAREPVLVVETILSIERQQFREEQQRTGHFATREVIGRDGVRRQVTPRPLHQIYGEEGLIGGARYQRQRSDGRRMEFQPHHVRHGRRCGNCRFFGHTRGRCPYENVVNRDSHLNHEQAFSEGVREAYVAGVTLLR